MDELIRIFNNLDYLTMGIMTVFVVSVGLYFHRLDLIVTGLAAMFLALFYLAYMGG